MAESPTSRMEQFWTRFRELPILERTWPAPLKQSPFDAFAEQHPDDAQTLRERYEFVHGFLIVPLVAIAGLINSGKSSLVASFLSDAGRRRVLRGMHSREGTQRFTLWAPAAWENDAPFRSRLDEMLTRVFHHAPEPLGADPESASEQQRAKGALSVPLMAFDTALDAHQIGLLDCPDIQRPQPGEEAGTNARLEALAAAGEICAGVIVVVDRKQLEVRELQNLLSRMPNATRIYAINLLRQESADLVLREAREHFALQNELCFGAYDFDVGANRAFTPAWDPNLASAGAVEKFPTFFELSPNPAENAPEAIGPDRSILRLAQHIAPDVLRQRRQTELIAELKRDFALTLDSLEASVRSTAAEIADARRELYAGCEQLLKVNGEVRIKMDPEIASSMAESIRRTAPLDLRAFFIIKHGVFSALRTLRNTGQRAVAALTLRLPIESAKQKLSDARIDPAQVQAMLSLWSAAMGTPRPPAEWSEDARRILERFLREERTNMTAEEWDALTSRLWERSERRWARAALVVGFLAMIGAVAMIPFDMGASFIGITAKELAVLTGGGVVFGLAGSTLLQRGLEEHIGRQQFINFFAIACDQLALPRTLPGDDAFVRGSPQIAQKRNPDGFGIRERQWTLAELLPKNLQTLRALLAQI
jgi:hypothetical protein